VHMGLRGGTRQVVPPLVSCCSYLSTSTLLVRSSFRRCHHSYSSFILSALSCATTVLSGRCQGEWSELSQPACPVVWTLAALHVGPPCRLEWLQSDAVLPYLASRPRFPCHVTRRRCQGRAPVSGCGGSAGQLAAFTPSYAGSWERV
jgi:hypothetical protein